MVKICLTRRLVPVLNNKNGDITSKSNYRPIALASVCSKILEMCIIKRVETFLFTNDNQFAYKKGLSTDMCIFLLKETIRHYMKSRSPVYVCFLDASKAFDCINHWKLFAEMADRNIPANLHV